MLTRQVGERVLGAVGLGTASMSLQGIASHTCNDTIHAALDVGVRLLDAAAAYTPDVASVGHSERLLAEAVAAWDGPRDEVLIVTKGGHRRVGDGPPPDAFIIDGRPEAIRKDAESSLAALGTERIDLYLLHWPDPNVPLADSFGTLHELRREGKVAMVGLSNVTVEQLNDALNVGPVDAVQNPFSVFRQGSRPVLEWCETHDVAFLAYSPLGGVNDAARLNELPALRRLAAEREVSVQQVALAWLLHQSDHLMPIVGARRAGTAADSAEAMHLDLIASELSQLDDETGDGENRDGR